MTIFTARPQKILGNVALASLIAGAPFGFLTAILAGIVIKPMNHSLADWIKQLGGGLLLGPFFVFIAGLILIVPALSALRYFGYGGPFFVYAIGIVFGLLILHDNLLFGAIVIVFSLTASYVFCRYAYSDSNDS